MLSCSRLSLAQAGRGVNATRSRGADSARAMLDPFAPKKRAAGFDGIEIHAANG
jgi:hypothetical protein